ncbi:sushi, nidogen and EGF-like domain-containing protein 1 [Diadema setosum]|uniref:sushi, nidogen and EGF-like domain-containing protein 1 n=1 Tax=Diadema setosum TaxID=31175 RepID=UPI003B3AD7E3
MLWVLFPFGHGVGDTFLERLDDGHAGPITLSTTFTFFDIPYDALFINIDGAISFQSKIRLFEPIRFPLTNDVIIAPFWADVNTDPSMGAGDVMFREELPTNENIAVFSRANGIIRDMFIEQELFQASWLLVATWNDVTFYDVESPSTGPKNTFQCVLVTDGDFSGVIFIYDTIRWTGGGSGANGGGNGYSTATGLGGIAAEVGRV